MTKAAQETPLMKQYNSIKVKYPDAILLFRVGDFYETFGEDAIYAAQILEITLTKRANGSASHIELAGFPHHALDTYLYKLVRSGKRVAICDQLEDPKTVKGIVKRGVTEVVTPGVVFNDNALSSKTNNYLLAVHQEKSQYGLALIDVSTGELLITQGNIETLKQIISGFKPNEIIYQRKNKLEVDIQGIFTFALEDWVFQYDYAYQKLTQHFKTNSLKGFGTEHFPLAIVAAGAIFTYIKEDTHHNLLDHIQKIQILPSHQYMWLDAFTIRNLELIQPSHLNGTSLLHILDKTQTAMGGRLLKRWILLPLKEKKAIDDRLDKVQFFLEQQEITLTIKESLQRISDIERLLGKIASAKATPREISILKNALKEAQKIQQILVEDTSKHFSFLPFQVEKCIEAIEKVLNDDLPIAISKGNVVKLGYNTTLDELRNLKENGQEFLQNMLQREQQRTDISSLKIDFNNVFGYYIEVRNTHKDKVPTDWIRKQTLVNAERYITEELKEYETQILGAEEKIYNLESQLFNEVLQQIQHYIPTIQTAAKYIAEWDCLVNFAQIAEENSYTKPEINNSLLIDLKESKHAVIEKLLPIDEPYIPNDIYLSSEKQQILMITGPNMSGKSALLRQVALVVLMAQMGSYVPTKKANIGIVDKIFTRVGASDNISQGESTFMVEMNETASILNNISERSLILLDEIGRGTSTYDGVSIAWAIAEYLHEHSAKPKTLFATHYHELNEMEQNFKRIKNFHVSIKESQGTILFMRKLQLGGSEHSFGIHVAKLAGMPSSLLKNAERILSILEEKSHSSSQCQIKKVTEENLQLSFFQLDDPVLENIREELINIDINTLTPIEAMFKLNQIKKMLGK